VLYIEPQDMSTEKLRAQLSQVTFCAMSKAEIKTAPLLLLLRVNALQGWRKLLAVREQSHLLTGLIGSFIVGYLVLSFWLFYDGLRFMAKFPGLGAVLTERLMYVLFAFLFGLLLLSNLVISHTNLFRNRETAFLLTLPVSTQTIFRWKFIESTLLASWAFLFLIAPLLAAFGLVRGAPWHFYLVTIFLITLFIVLPGVIGAGLAIVIGRFLDRRSFQIAIIGIAVALLAFAAFWWKTQAVDDELLDKRTLEALDQLLAKTHFTMFPFLPSYWLSSALLQWAEGILRGSAFFAMVLLSNTLFFGSIAFTKFGNVFYDTASAVQSRAGGGLKLSFLRTQKNRRLAIGLLEKISAKFSCFNCDTRALAIKDIRMFWRDTTQWGQSVMLFGLLGVYIINLRNFTHELTSTFWVNLVAFLNLGACSLNLATLTTRFVFPQFSLEGRRLWIVGMSPMGLARVVKVKYWLASFASLLATLSLITLSCWLLKMTWDRIVFFGAVVTVMTFALNGLAVGLGVLYPNLKETNSSKIVSGFGGTLCLVLSSVYVLAAIALLVFGTMGLHAHAGWAVESVIGFVALSFVIGWLPLKFGLRQLKNFEA
ncbi:MAG: putative ABC transporter permease subunit, partial [Limisphaerales bacterium]